MVVPISFLLQKSFKPVVILLTGLIAYQLALFTWSLSPQNESKIDWVAPTAKASSKSNKIITDSLQKQDLFGKVQKESVKVQVTEEVSEAPKTTLKVSLVGVVAATNPQYSSAIIEYRKQQSSYFVDSVIEGTKAKVSKIYQDRVLLDVNGALQTLMLDGIENLDKQQQRHESARPKSISKKKPSNKKVKNIALDRAALIKNPGRITDYIKISPMREDGEIKGYRVSPGKNKQIFEEAGLKRGDLAVAMNGTDLTDMQQALSLMKSLPTMTDISLTVEREGQLHELYFSIP